MFVAAVVVGAADAGANDQSWGEFKFKIVSFFLFIRIALLLYSIIIISCGHTKCVYNKRQREEN